MTVQTLLQAIGLVTEDVRQSYPRMTVEQCLAHAYSFTPRNNLDESELGQAYKLVFAVYTRAIERRERAEENTLGPTPALYSVAQSLIDRSTAERLR